MHARGRWNKFFSISMSLKSAISIGSASMTIPRAIDESSQKRRGRSTQRKTNHELLVDRKPAMKRSGFEIWEHIDTNRKVPATATTIDDDNNDDDGKRWCEPRERVRRPCSLDSVRFDVNRNMIDTTSTKSDDDDER